MVVTIDLFCYEYIVFLKCHIALHVISILMKQASGNGVDIYANTSKIDS